MMGWRPELTWAEMQVCQTEEDACFYYVFTFGQQRCHCRCCCHRRLHMDLVSIAADVKYTPSTSIGLLLCTAYCVGWLVRQHVMLSDDALV
jgi:hypothetical protein